MRRRAEGYARLKGYDDKTLITMCSTVSRSLELVLLRAGFQARMVVGRFYGEGHFWVEVTPAHVDQPMTIVDLTATQFDWLDPEPSPVVIAHYTDSFGALYQVEHRARGEVRSCIQTHDWPDVLEFEGRTRRWCERVSSSFLFGHGVQPTHALSSPAQPTAV